MEFFDIFIPIDMDSLDVKKRDTIRAYFIFLICIIFIGISIYSFSRVYARHGGDHIALCFVITIANSIIGMAIWVGILALYRLFSGIIFRKEETVQTSENYQTGVSRETMTPFRPKATKEVEAFVVEYLTTHHQSWQWACLYSALLDSLMIDANQSAFYKYISSRYPELVNVKLRSFQHAVHENEEGARTNSSECEDEIERIKKELKNLA